MLRMRVAGVHGHVEFPGDLWSRQVCRQVPQNTQLGWAKFVGLREEVSVGARRRCASQQIEHVCEKRAMSRLVTG